MKSRMLLCLLFAFAMTGYAGIGPKNFVKYVPKNPDAAGDTIYIPGGTLAGGENAGSLETTINQDTLTTGGRKNVDRVYALYEGQYYYQIAPIYCYNPTGTLTICGVPDPAQPTHTTKPVILISPVPPATTEGTNTVYGSIVVDNIHYQAQMLTGSFNAELFYCGTAQHRAQSLRINNCLFEFSSIDLFDCTNESGAIGGWPFGATFFITNSYFRNMFQGGQWWGSRVFQCKHPIDTLWIENVTTATAGLTFLQQNELTDFEYVNHCTILNNHKYWILSPYHRHMFITNNIFVNQNWVGEDTNVTNSGQDPDKYFMSTINVDTNNATNGLVTQKAYWLSPTDSTHFNGLLALNHLQVYVSDNINFYSPALTTGYYNNSKYTLAFKGQTSLPSYLNWAGAGTGPWIIGNTPGQWKNSRTTALFAAYGPTSPAPGPGGFIEKRTSTTDPGFTTPIIASANIIDSMAVWNQNLWSDTRFAGGSALQNTHYIFGDYNPTTLPGISGGVKTDAMTTGQAGITKFTDLTENFAQSTQLSGIDGLPIGALIWDDTKLAAYNSASDWALVHAKYMAEGGVSDGITTAPSTVPGSYKLDQNYPNPFNPSTMIKYSLPQSGIVKLVVYDVLGREVRTLVNGAMPAGAQETRWDGKNSNGQTVGSGIYFYKLTAGSFTATKKMTLIK